MLIVDGHQDLAWNMVTFGRDYTRSAEETRRLECGTEVPALNGDTLLGWPEYQRGRVAVIFASLFAAPLRWQEGAWDTQCYATPEQANELYRAQLALYERLVGEHGDQFQLVCDQAGLQRVLDDWQQETEAAHLVGLVVCMENAEGVRSPAELDEWWAWGVRLIGPAWAGTRFCGGTREPGPLTKEGYALLDAMADLGFGLDLAHMDEKAALQALDYYPGTIVATHANVAALLDDPDNRFLSDRVLRGLIERDGVIGVIPANRFLRSGWRRSAGRETLTLAEVVAHIDTICQMAGDARHVALGSDFDGGFGWQDVPVEIDTIADLQNLVPVLAARGYSEADVAAVMHGNWLEVLDRVLPEDGGQAGRA